jgi:probable rRNA maturation factor
MNFKINVIINEKRVLKKTSKKFIQNVAKQALESEKQANKLEINLVFIDNTQMEKLNSNYRGKNKPTNVLSFPYKNSYLIGEVVFAYETILQESIEHAKTFEDHIAHLIVHGILHVLGHDHEKSEKEAKIMEAKEVKILKKLGIKNPYVIN